MKEESPHDIARKISVYIYVVLTLTLLPLVLYYTHGWKPIVVFTAVMGVVFYAIWRLIKYNIEFFVYRRIKLIYKTISKLKTNKYPQEAMDYETDIIGDVNKDVLQWEKESKNEIRQLKEQAKYRKEFIGNLAHELRTPAFNMQGYLLTLIEGGLEDPKINTKYLARADKNLDRLIYLINDLDKITRLEAGEDPLEMEEFDLVDLANELVDYQEDRASEKEIEITVANSDKPLKVMADKEKISQVFTNLIVNAIRYGKDKGWIKIRFYDMADNILVEIEDNGIGIAEENIPRLFERFYRVDKSRARHSGGTGLGLAIVRHIIDAHQQTINVRSAIGEGSVFSFTLAKA
ncbi:sensor histidine kinase [bacterium SCSIO 12643]|nr:sensor histidine kinase [bacterium SCSIO 12643]